MKQFIRDFLLRGLMAGGFGPPVLAVSYLVLQRYAGVQTVTVAELCRGIFSLWALAFLAGGMNAIYQLEQLPLAAAVLLHGGVLYLGYLGTYLLNGWLQQGTAPLLVFSVVFALGYLAVWAVICATTRRRAARLNRLLRQKQQAGPMP